jgi:hypothetical protein
VRDAQGYSVRSVRQVAPGQHLDIELADGHVAAQAKEPGVADEGRVQQRSPARRGEPVRSKTRTEPQGGQGSLF